VKNFLRRYTNQPFHIQLLIATAVFFVLNLFGTVGQVVSAVLVWVIILVCAIAFGRYLWRLVRSSGGNPVMVKRPLPAETVQLFLTALVIELGIAWWGSTLPPTQQDIVYFILIAAFIIEAVAAVMFYMELRRESDGPRQES